MKNKWKKSVAGFALLIAIAALFCVHLPAYASSENSSGNSTGKISTETAAVVEPSVDEEEASQAKKSPGIFHAPAADTTWQNDFDFDTDESGGYITLRKYNGSETELVIQSKAVIGKVTYKVKIGNSGESGPYSAFKDTGVRKLSFEKGVMAADEPSLFQDTNLEELDLTGLDTSGMTTMRMMFYRSKNLKKLVLTGIDTSHVRDMSYMFGKLFSLTQADVTMLDLGAVTTLEKWFFDCKSIEQVNAKGVRTPSLKKCKNIFNNCRSLKYVDISSFDFSGVTDTSQKWTVFWQCGPQSMTINKTVLIPGGYQKDDSSLAFLCWNTKEDGTGRNYYQGQYYDGEGPVTLYASKWIPTAYTAQGMDGYELFKNGDADNKEYVYCLNKHLGLPSGQQFAITEAENFGGFTEKQKLMMAAAILMKDHADGASVQNVIWRITDNYIVAGTKSAKAKDEAYYTYLTQHCEELEGIYEMKFYISSDNSIQNLLSAQQVRVPTSLKIVKRLEGTAGEDKKQEYRMQLKLTDGSGSPLTGTYSVKKGESEEKLTPDAQGKCSISLEGNQYAVIRNLPVGTKYAVTEDPASAEGFEVSYENEEGSIEKDAARTVTVTNSVIPEIGNLTVEKTVRGSMGDRSRKFDFTICLSRDGKPVSGSFDRTDSGKIEFDADGKAAIQLSHGESVTITGIPAGTSYSITEEGADEEGYTTTSDGDSGTISADGSTASFVNTREGTVPTGADTGGLSGRETGTLAVILFAALAGWSALKRFVVAS